MGCKKLQYEPKLTVHIGGKTQVGNPLNLSRLPQKNRVETGYYYYGARYYNPKVSNWLSVDPLAIAKPQDNMLAYTYVNNNPIRFTDPTGLKGEDWVEVDGKYIYDSNVKNQQDAKEVYGDKARHLQNGTKVVDRKPNGEVANKYTLGEGGSITNQQNQKLSSVQLLNGKTTIDGQDKYKKGEVSLFGDSNFDIKVGPQLNITVEIAGVSVGIQNENTINAKDLGKINPEQNKVASGQLFVGIRGTETTHSDNSKSYTQDVFTGPLKYTTTEQFNKITVGVGVSGGLGMGGFDFGGEVGIKIRR